ncbi:Serine_threonine-protein kinase PknD [Streptomyces sp. enrichment culture]|uniref:serine/threonine-protein kinase n=1 Tax=Streptomyces sp. enrichment culture TaxID=1795815 RepID=UPI003F574B49
MSANARPDTDKCEARVEKLKLQRSEWELGSQLGEGGFGRVFEACSLEGELAVVKLIPKEPGAERELLFKGNGAPNVVPVIDSGEHDDAWVIVMPRAERPLDAYLRDSGGVLSVDETVAVLRDIAIALEGLDGGVVHRDLKPANVLFLDGHWCLADFGLARYTDAATATHTWKGAGTRPYMAPEVWRNERATTATDIYSVGIIAHQLLTGDLPFRGPKVSDYHDQHLHALPPALTGVPTRLAALVEECLLKPPQARPTPANMLAKLDRMVQQPLAGGLAVLAAADRGEVVRKAEEHRRRSEYRTEQERREDLVRAAESLLSRFSDACLTAFAEAAPNGRLDRAKNGGWTFELGQAGLAFSYARTAAPEVWSNDTRPPFDIIAYAAMSLRLKGASAYQGRSHSLWYCDAQVQGEYRWFETAFMTTPLMAQGSAIEPFALLPDSAARGAVGPGIDVRQVAWPFMPLEIAEPEEFIDRWASWLAAGSQGRLGRPSQMPERPIQGTWRRS